MALSLNEPFIFELIPQDLLKPGSAQLKTLNRLDRACFEGEDLYDKLKGDDPECPGTHFWWLFRFASSPRPCGFSGLKIYPGGAKSFLCRVGVLPAFRGLGWQLQSIKERLVFGRDRGVTLFQTYTSCSNYASANNLIRCGFRIVPPWFDAASPHRFIFFQHKVSS